MFAEALLASLLAANSTCVDMGQLYNDYVINECINYYSVPANIEQKKLDKKLGEMFSFFKANGTQLLILSQAQLNDLELLEKGVGIVKTSNPISSMMSSGYLSGPYTVGNTKMNFLQYFSDFAKKSNSNLSLTFGGPDATSSDMKIGPLAFQQVKNVIKNYNLANITVDLRGNAAKSLIEQNTAEDLQKFLQRIRCASLVIDANFERTQEVLKPLFNQLNKLFSDITIVLQPENDNTIDFSKVSSEIKSWTNVFNPKNIHIAFSDKVTYTLPKEDVIASKEEVVTTQKVTTSPKHAPKAKPKKRMKIAKHKGKKQETVKKIEVAPQSTSASVVSMPENLTNGQNAAHMYKMWNARTGAQLGDPVFYTGNTLQLESNKFIQEFEAYLSK